MGMIKAVVIGAAGYSGREAVGLLLAHPDVRLVGLFGSGRHGGDAEGSVAFGSAHPLYRGRTDLEIQAFSMRLLEQLSPDVVFLATPHEASHDLAPALLEHGCVVVDISGAFRLKEPEHYPKHYGFEHRHPALLERAVYGLPEINRDPITRADLIAVAGCYPTSAILPLAPLVRAGAVDRSRRPIVDSISGVSGAGRTPSPKNHICEVSAQPYNVFTHRHTPEIDDYAGVPVVFTPHLGAFDRGILSTIHVELAPGWDGARVSAALAGAYSEHPFVRLLPPGEWPSVLACRMTNYCDIGWAVDHPNRHLIMASALDNLLKGAAGQAVQCMNIRFGLPEAAGILPGIQ